ncbi:MAG: serine/threonine-protein kinase [Chloroflexota bacterium]|nr:serine/threonine-protein kinase [Chloroflexota bacterium]
MLDIRAGSRVGPYKVVAPLEEAARGGTSTLFLAQLAQVDGSQLVIVKLVPVEGEGGEGGGVFELNALRKEVGILQKLRHPGIVKIYPIPSRNGRRERYISRAANVPGKPWFCALEHLGGGSLESRLKELTILPLGEAVEIAYQIGAALDYMHAKGYVHWDVKPDNILFRHPWSENGAGAVEAVLTDFGIARSTHEPAVVAGSVRYMSPERLRVHLGEIPPDQVMDQRPADVYALGLVLYEMLSGDLPFAAEDMESIKIAILEDTPIPLTDFNPEVPPAVEDIIFQALNKHPAARPAMEEMVTMLDRAVPAPRVGVRVPSMPGVGGEMAEGGAVRMGVSTRRPAPSRPGEREVEPRERRPSPAERLQQWALTAVAVGVIVIGGLWVMGRTMGVGPLAPTPTPTVIPTEVPTETPAPTVVPAAEMISLSPASAVTDEGSVEITIVGENFQESVDVFLSGAQGDIPATGVNVYGGGKRLWCSFNISGVEPGVWSVLVESPDGTLSELPNAFTVVAPTPTPTPTNTPAPTPTPTRVYRAPAPTDVPPPPPTSVPQPSGGGGGGGGGGGAPKPPPTIPLP